MGCQRMGQSHGAVEAAVSVGGCLSSAVGFPNLAEPPPIPPATLQLLVNLPLPGWLPVALLPAALVPLVPGAGAAVGGTSQLQLNLKWGVRRAALAIGAAMLLYAFFTHRDYERESYK